MPRTFKTESALQKAIIAFVESEGWGVYKVHATAMSKGGMPDLIVWRSGFMYAFEVKKPGENPTQRQVVRIGEIINTGAVAFVVDNLEIVKDILDTHPLKSYMTDQFAYLQGPVYYDRMKEEACIQHQQWRAKLGMPSANCAWTMLSAQLKSESEN